MDQIGEERLGASWEATIKVLNETAPLTLRINTLKTDFASLSAVLSKKGVRLIKMEGLPNAALVAERTNLFTLDEFKDGLFEIQDAGSQLIPLMTGAKLGLRVVAPSQGLARRVCSWLVNRKTEAPLLPWMLRRNGSWKS